MPTAPPELDRLLGLDVYATQTNGIGGKIRGEIEDFQVEELLVDGSKAHIISLGKEAPALGATLERQRHLLCVLVKQNWDTFIAAKNVASQLGLGQNSLQIAGIKDAKAVTAQYVTIENLTNEDIANVNVRGVQMRSVGYLRNSLSVFYLLGNHFKIKITGITQKRVTVNEQVNQIINEVTQFGGIPNFYGHQRFGTTRPITHLVGKALIDGKFEEAAFLFLAKPSPDEHSESRQARIELQQTHDFKAALEHYPKQLRYERLMLKSLNENPNEFVKAFNVLPMKLQILFVQAYQSYLFNRFLSERVKADLPLNKAEVGDLIVGVERTGLPMVNMSQTVTAQSQNRVNEAIAAGKMRLALPIVGFKQKLSSGIMGEIEQRVLQQEDVNMNGFYVAVNSKLGGKGSLRTALAPVNNFKQIEISEDNNGLTVSLSFMLLRGCYATVLLREIIKPQNLVIAGF
ncbi:MAG: tRNA pseudouridine(13) synthase TruD [Candidatus Bathyarchaeota archaeon]|uniref:tRNA pseudouridine(13) synthase TruD n=1 Tax=Candidatus Bathycorpusculum sp. TaxID=2994959 RepID=UPI00282A5D62|nr:tRNA pseudouridine(13) synthase TruD [Candidatus Termiticorpusculum sp.]MCL2257726.1 tRNA pseudouridine(13) synthase TruD [Candidatus Termiticorpusculum sp.]MCL2292143.1 tRNA pseudouridine(13) synthase TruD [Candidatus Termiticorpusculum sp.]